MGSSPHQRSGLRLRCERRPCSANAMQRCGLRFSLPPTALPTAAQRVRVLELTVGAGSLAHTGQGAQAHQQI